MSSGRKTVTAFLTIICGLLLVILGLCADWPLWVWPVVVAALIAVPLLLAKLAGRRPDPLPRALLHEPDLPIPPLERREHLVSQVALPSKEADYDFLFSAMVRWHPADTAPDAPVINPGALAIEAVLERARRITEVASPARSTLVQHELNGALGTMRPAAGGQVMAMAENVTLMLSDIDQARLDKLAAVRKDEAVWEHERKYEQNRRAYLGTDVLRDTGSAVVWWLARNDDQVEKTVKDLGLLAQLTSAANNTDVPSQLRHLVPYPLPQPAPYEHNGHAPAPRPEAPASAADHFAALLEAMGLAEDDPQRALFARQMAHTAASYASPEAGEELLARFDTPVTPVTPATSVPSPDAFDGAPDEAEWEPEAERSP
ncbi:hypothetical protein ACFZCY_29790 [Streptomyces sp. NPDC007983]|uniref:hypothetical protein n=1 Tax=Streptomyces sp. NPDC007983 TaxID=3364800 RepID=UPI0036E687B0